MRYWWIISFWEPTSSTWRTGWDFRGLAGLKKTWLWKSSPTTTANCQLTWMFAIFRLRMRKMRWAWQALLLSLTTKFHCFLTGLFWQNGLADRGVSVYVWLRDWKSRVRSLLATLLKIGPTNHNIKPTYFFIQCASTRYLQNMQKENVYNCIILFSPCTMYSISSIIQHFDWTIDGSLEYWF